MALKLSLSYPPIRSPPSTSCTFTQTIMFSSDHLRCSTSDVPSTVSLFVNNRVKHKKTGFSVRSTLDTAGPVVGQVTEVHKDTFWPLVNAAGDKTVVLDMNTQW